MNIILNRKCNTKRLYAWWNGLQIFEYLCSSGLIALKNQALLNVIILQKIFIIVNA